MLRQITRTLVMGLCSTCSVLPTVAIGQVVVESNMGAACGGVLPCPVRPLTHGFYQESWRRWPEDPGTSIDRSRLSPFATPRGVTPKVDVPSAEDENRLAPRRRPTGDWTAPPRFGPEHVRRAAQRYRCGGLGYGFRIRCTGRVAVLRHTRTTVDAGRVWRRATDRPGHGRRSERRQLFPR